MTTYPLPTLAPTIGPDGISAPPYSDILLSLIASYQAIFGSDAQLDADDQDGQWIAIFAKAQSDSNQTAISVYNQFSPATSFGTGLSSVVKINGISRLVPSNSTAVVTIVGQAGTTINNGLVGDNLNLGTQWALPASVTVPSGGSISVTATCTTAGAVAAGASTLTVILTPTAGWQTVTNPSVAAVGQPVETDAALRRRQASSTQLPAQTVLGAIVGNIENLPGVEQVKPYENDTNTTDSNSLPPHSICLSIIGGDLQDIVNIIGAGKVGTGCSTYGGGIGATSGTYTDPISGIVYTINFNIPTPVRIVAEIDITPLTGYSTAVGNEIIAAVVASVNSLGIGQNVLYTRQFAPALLQGPFASPASPNDANTYELTAVKIGIYPSSPGAGDIAINFNQYATLQTSDVNLVVA